jgi:hypothetical protein
MNDPLIISLYVRRNTPADRVVSDPAVLQGFTDEYCKASGDSVAPAQMGHHLLNLRRRGQQHGGLPRLRRRYDGRDMR